MTHNMSIVSAVELDLYIHRRKFLNCKTDPRLEQAYAERAVTKPDKYPDKFSECLRNAKSWYKTLDRDTKLHVHCLLRDAGVDLKKFENHIYYLENYMEFVYGLCHNVITKKPVRNK